ncbi:MAG: proton-conducting transporter membrane subunit [Candidatus Bathyarchaeota archaeon]|nr:proton-conducting transporter membrane subunit [Candidatus Bathyarchaeota archaeon]MDH5779305.1 proton-conducting transporter membrane subunit [Candidatus Bathyarchaeota archaeon]
MFTPLLDSLLVFTITTPLINVLAQRVASKKLVTGYVAFGLALTLLLLPIYYMEGFTQGKVTTILNLSAPPIGVCLEIDALGLFMVLIFLLIGLAVSIYSFQHIEPNPGLIGYNTLLLGMITGMVGVVLAGDLFTLFIFWEIMCVSSYALVAFRKEEWEPVEAGYKYLIMSAAGAATLLFGMSFLYGMTGTLNIAYLSASFAQSEGTVWMYLILTMIIAGFGLQAGMAPLHMWLPDAHSAAPSPISAVLSGAMVKTAAYGLIRVLMFVFPMMHGAWGITLAIFAVLTMFTGNLMALLQDDIKRLLAFSTIANMGYILLGLSIGSLRGLTGSMFHIFNHALVKALLFLSVGSFVYRTKTRSLKELAGIGRSMPISSGLFAIGVIALAGIPPLNFFWSELTIVTAGVEAGMLPFSILMILNLALSAAYCLRMIQTIFLKETTAISEKATEAPKIMLVATIILAFLSIVIGFYPSPFQDMAGNAAGAAVDRQAYLDAVFRE